MESSLSIPVENANASGGTVDRCEHSIETSDRQEVTNSTRQRRKRELTRGPPHRGTDAEEFSHAGGAELTDPFQVDDDVPRAAL